MTSVKKFLVTTAVNETRLHAGFWSSMQKWAEHEGGEIVVVASTYKNPTAKRGRKKLLRDATYAAQVVPYLTNKRRVLGKNLTLFADIPVQPTATNPLNGLAVLAAHSSGIIGHVKRGLKVVPSEKTLPRVLWATGACTVGKYSRSKAGALGRSHHTLGALVVEVKPNGIFYIRNVSATSAGRFTDLDTTYTPEGAFEAAPALTLTLGDLHVGQTNPQALAGAQALTALVRPQYLVLHDVLDMHTRSHHQKSYKERLQFIPNKVEDEVSMACQALRTLSGWPGLGDGGVVVVESNHHEHLARWLEEHDLKTDPLNTGYWHKLWADMHEFKRVNGQWPNPFALEARRMDVPESVQFLKRGASFKVGGVEGAFHGDEGQNGARGSIQAYTQMGCKSTIAHSHTPGIQGPVFQVGTNTHLRLSYSRGISTCMYADVVLHADGKRQLVTKMLDGSFRA